MKTPASLPWSFWLAGVIGLAMAMVLVVLYLFDPATHGFYPICPLHQFTGLLCPGCGTLRALHQLTHGNFAAAWRLNPIVIMLIPCAFWLAARELIWLKTGRRLPGVVTNPIFGWVLLAGLIVFGILRNIPVSR